MSAEMSDYVAENKLKRPSGTHHSLRLQDQVRNPKLWPTPQASDHRDRGNLNTPAIKRRPGEGETANFIDERIGDIWTVEPDVGRVAHGVPKRVDRLRGLGNAIVPQIAALIMQMIKDDMNL